MADKPLTSFILTAFALWAIWLWRRSGGKFPAPGLESVRLRDRTGATPQSSPNPAFKRSSYFDPEARLSQEVENAV